MKPSLSFLQLEDRLTPALNVLSSAGSLLITGTPEATSPGMYVGHNQEVSVTRIYGFTYEVKDRGQPVGPGDHGVPGEYNIFGDLKLKFDSINNDVVVDLDGGPLTGNLSIDLGKGDIDTNTPNYITVVNGTVGGGVSFAGAPGNESIAVGIPIKRYDPRGYGPRWEQGLEGSSPVTVEQGVVVSGRGETLAPGASPFSTQNDFQLGEGSLVSGNLSASGVHMNYISGTVNGKVDVRWPEARLNSTLTVNGQVGGNVTFDSVGQSFADIGGTVNGSVALRGQGEYTGLRVNGQVGKDISVDSTRNGYATIAGTVQNDAFVRANKAELTITATGTLGDDARVFSTGSSADSKLTVAGRVVEDVQGESSGAAKATISGAVMGDVAVKASNAYTVSRDVSAFLDVTGLVGQDVSVTTVGGGPVGVTIAGTVSGNVAMLTNGSTGATLSVTGSGQVGKDVTVDSKTPSGRINVNLAGKVNRNVVLLTDANVTTVDVTGQVVGALNITDGDGDLTVTITDPVLKARAVIVPGEGDYTLN